MKNVGLLAFLGGAVVGAAVAMLITPKRGDETRQMINDMIHKGIKRCPICGHLGCHCQPKTAEQEKIDSDVQLEK